jgi:hypothetical protein
MQNISQSLFFGGELALPRHARRIALKKKRRKLERKINAKRASKSEFNLFFCFVHISATCSCFRGLLGLTFGASRRATDQQKRSTTHNSSNCNCSHQAYKKPNQSPFVQKVLVPFTVCYTFTSGFETRFKSSRCVGCVSFLSFFLSLSLSLLLSLFVSPGLVVFDCLTRSLPSNKLEKA